MRQMIFAVLAAVLFAQGGAQAQTPATEPLMSRAIWQERPDASVFERYYPIRAMVEEVEGRVVLDCVADETGSLLCNVHTETPANYGFGPAAIRISQHFRVAPLTSDGQPVTGGRVRIPIRFALEDTPPATP